MPTQNDNRLQLGILGSTKGTDMMAIIDAIAQKKLIADIAIVISNKQEAGILEKAKNHHLHYDYIAPENMAREIYDKKVSAVLSANRVDLVILIGYMRIVSADFVENWRGKILNVHPSLLPAFSGGMDNNVHQAVLDAGIKETGCTVHYVTEDVDAGPILIQKKCMVLPDDTTDTLKMRVQQLEGQALIEAIIKHSGKTHDE